MRTFVKNKERSTFGLLHHNPGLGGLATHDQTKSSNPIKSKHRHTNRKE